jgi:hypothetical protein
MRYLLFALLILSCNRNPKTTTTDTTAASAPAEIVLTKDFTEFYARFHSDSLFQVEHIIWPLEGNTTIELDSNKVERKSIKFEQKDWVMHSPLEGPDFVQTWTSMTEGIYEESIRYAAANYGMSRRFAKIAGQWYLIHYSDMQDLGQGPQAEVK